MASSRGADNGNVGHELAGQYVNHLAVRLSLSEIQLRFGQRSSLDAEPVLKSLLVSTAVHLVDFRRVIVESIADYERRFGRIPDASVFDLDAGKG